MGFVGDTQKIDGGSGSGSGSGDKGGCFMRGMKSLVRRKQVDSANSKSSSASGSAHQLAKALTIPHLIAIGCKAACIY
ncbi:hypothetical protein HAX54_018234 [Datura stramonium]|uniref:Uncharacterized protein n=1 Tax=Datura stramonium TaxID=4076 RepID=A0ABS8UM23_DATST|nr:hypothetical protein [Datura stramonium]